MADLALRLTNVWKRFRLGSGHDSLAELLGGAWRALRGSRQKRVDGKTFWALSDLSFSLCRGDALGIIGPNGAGKSTALKLLAGILRPDRGTVEVHGRLASLIEVGAGFHGDLTGRENIFLNGAILGMSRSEVRRKLDRIIGFAGLEAFVDTPVKRYSSGMYARLGFSIAAHVDPEILLVDEVLSVGDAVFRLRCEQRMRELVRKGTSLIFVTHNLEQMQSICDRAVVLEAGRCGFSGTPRDAVGRYMTAMSRAFCTRPTDITRTDDDVPVGDVHLRFANGNGDELAWMRSGESLIARASFTMRASRGALAVELAAKANSGESVLCFNSARFDRTFKCPLGPNEVSMVIENLPLSGGRYFWNLRIWDKVTGETLADTPFRYPLVIDDEGRSTGQFCVAHGWRHVTGVRAVEVPRAGDSSVRAVREGVIG